MWFNIVSMGVHEVVHIVPLGYEIDRAVAPFEREGGMVANRVRILTLREDNVWGDEEEHYLKEVQRRLRALRIRSTVEDVNTFQLRPLMDAMSRAIRSEKDDGNDVWVNMSAAGKIQALGASIAAMVHGARLYYVPSTGYTLTLKDRRKHGLGISDGSVQVLESVPLELPDERSMRALVSLAASPDGLYTEQILDGLRRHGFTGFGAVGAKSSRLEKTNYLMKLNKGVLEPLETLGYVSQRERVGRRKRVKITTAGAHIASLAGFAPPSRDR